jgi:hypothetical protein
MARTGPDPLEEVMRERPEALCPCCEEPIVDHEDVGEFVEDEGDDGDGEPSPWAAAEAAGFGKPGPGERIVFTWVEGDPVPGIGGLSADWTDEQLREMARKQSSKRGGKTVRAWVVTLVAEEDAHVPLFPGAP